MIKSRKTRVRKSQRGVMLLECLIAILIFSLGILAIVGLQAMAVKQVTDAKYRSEAGLLTNQLLGSMWASNRTPAALMANFNSGGTGYTAWVADVDRALPGIAANPPDVVVDPNGQVTITVYWLAPNEAPGTQRHKFSMTSMIKG